MGLRVKHNNKPVDDIQFEFSDIMGISVELNPVVFTENDITKVYEVVAVLQKSIVIDKSFVDFDGTKYEKTFMTEDGWNNLLDLVKSTNYGKIRNESVESTLNDAYKGIILCFIEQVFSDLGYDVNAMRFSTKSDFSVNVKYVKDTIKAWKSYPGKWQNW